MKKEIDEYFLSLDEYCKDLFDKAGKLNADNLEKIDYLVDELKKFEDRELAIKDHLEHVKKTEESLSKEQVNLSQEKDKGIEMLNNSFDRDDGISW